LKGLIVNSSLFFFVKHVNRIRHSWKSNWSVSKVTSLPIVVIHPRDDVQMAEQELVSKRCKRGGEKNSTITIFYYFR
jgi:hypothetical protein